MHDLRTIVGRIDHFAAETPDKVAIEFGDRTITYAQLARSSAGLATVLRAKGLGAAQRVCLLASNAPEYLIFYHAVLRCGSALFPINADLSSSEIAYILGHADPVLAVCDASHSLPLADAQARAARPVPSLVLEDLFREAGRVDGGAAPAPLQEPREDDLALVIYTSGTTSLPKGVPATHRIELLSADAFASQWQVTADDRFVCALPLSFLFGLHTATMVAFAQGATVLLFEKFNPVRVLEGIASRRGTVMLGVPTMYAMMLEHVSETGKRYDLGSVRLAVSSGAPLAGPTRDAIERRLGMRVQDYYALSECRPIFSFHAGRLGDAPDGSVGMPVAGVEYRIVDEAGADVPCGEIGSLIVRSPTLMSGYFRDPERTAGALIDGWLLTGDLGRRDEEGAIYISGRTRDQVISGGQKISAVEVESVLLQHPAVAQAAAVGVPDEKYGELLKAAIVLRAAMQLDEDELRRHCKERLAAYKVPRLISFLDALPVSPAGKVLKRELIER
ncbi:AMP-binding protein [Variovorax ureilyticus]|uniref:AMP-binding protein n=1 Tax=Variovorax ureilyticus TaxID=1836198 RepID=A0ABU8VHP1_9BURK